jgi:hypothetical protein
MSIIIVDSINRVERNNHIFGPAKYAWDDNKVLADKGDKFDTVMAGTLSKNPL